MHLEGVIYLEGDLLQDIATIEDKTLVGGWHNKDHRIHWVDDAAKQRHDSKVAARDVTRADRRGQFEVKTLVEFNAPGAPAAALALAIFP